MKKTIACCALLLWAMQAPLCAQASPEAEETKAGTDQGEEELSLQELKGGLQEAFGGMVGVMGAIMGGLSSGLREELTSAVNVSVLSAEKPAEKSWRIFLAFRNQRDFPVRLTSLTRKQNVLLQDAEGFVYELAAGENAQRVITIPAQAAVKVPFDFVRVDAVPRSMRLYGKDIPFPDGQ